MDGMAEHELAARPPSTENGGEGIMKGINFVTDDKGRKVAVMIDLKEYGELWEDIYDSLLARERADEPRESWESVKKRLEKQDKLGD
jgi:hypothetical protein